MQRHGSHTVSRITAHIVWVSKYRYHVLTGEVQKRCREVIIQICNSEDVKILKGVISKDHVHMFVSVPPHLAMSKLVQYLKGKSSYKLMQENKQLSRMFWGRYLWARGYFVATSGNVTDEIILEYIKNQDEDPKDEEFTISE